jgi:SAM-dependent methyltransferase
MTTTFNTIRHHEQENEKLFNKEATTYYRRYDEEFVYTPSYNHFSKILFGLTISFTHRISVLDVGCGTGRYFHCLDNLKELTGIDISANMLEEAKVPFKRASIPLSDINLIHGSFYDHDFGTKQFDFIYSVGVLGEHAPFDQHTAQKLCDLLSQGGMLYFTIVDIKPRKTDMRKLAEAIYPYLPGTLKRVLDKRWETLYMTYEQVDAIMKNTPFSSYTLTRHIARDPKWKGAHLECIATK